MVCGQTTPKIYGLTDTLTSKLSRATDQCGVLMVSIADSESNNDDKQVQAILKKLPEVVMCIEQFDCLVITISKYFGDEDMIKPMRHSIARDFRIKLMGEVPEGSQPRGEFFMAMIVSKIG